jgi:hypothetical protein
VLLALIRPGRLRVPAGTSSSKQAAPAPAPQVRTWIAETCSLLQSLIMSCMAPLGGPKSPLGRVGEGCVFDEAGSGGIEGERTNSGPVGVAPDRLRSSSMAATTSGFPRQAFTASPGGVIVSTPGRFNSEGNVWPGYSQLGEAAGKPADQQTDWERRTLGAARWWFQAATHTWPSAALVAAMSAIEALMSFRGEKTGKHKTIAKRLVKGRARVRGVDDVESWFRQIHGRWRNNAAHDALFYLEDREVARAVELAEAIVRWAVGHLDPWHTSPYGACTTIEEAHGPHDTG